MAAERPIYPFSALVGQERLKRALVLNAVNQRIGGVLIRGEKGTAKSTAVRGLARLLPPIDIVANDPYNSSPTNTALMSTDVRARFDAGEELPQGSRPTPLIELPVAASEDRVVGSLDLEHALTEGQRRYEPGLLAQANRGILYVDEVNLLDDHLVDVLLDAAAMGVNTVEREGISISHPARFVLVGTMNPEEGELRPQLLDRFGLVVEISGITDISGRVAVIERRMAYDANPTSFTQEWQAEEQEIANRIIAARALLPAVKISRSDMTAVAALVLELGVDGHRADLAILETARTLAAWSSRAALTLEDIRLAAELALPHRMRRQPFTEVKLDEGRMNAILDRASGEEATENSPSVEGVKKKAPVSEQSSEGEEREGEQSADASPSASGQMADGQQASQNQGGGEAKVTATSTFKPKKIEGQRDRMARRAVGKRSRTKVSRNSGRYIASRPAQRVTDLALDATLREAAIYQRERREAESEPAQRQSRRVIIRRNDLRQKIRVRKTRNAVCFVVDASWSMAAEERMRATKNAVLSLLRDAYQRRDMVGLISFQRDYATLLLPLTSSIELAQKHLQTMPTGRQNPAITRAAAGI